MLEANSWVKHRAETHLGDQALQAGAAKLLDNTELGKMGPEGVR